MNRVLVIGCSAGGKSTVARELSDLLGIEVIHLDKVLWKSGCQLSDETEEPERVRELLDRPRWVMDGNYTISLPMRLAAADTIVFVDYPRTRCFVRALRRLLTYFGRTRPDMGANCPETLNFNLLKWIWDYPKKERPQLIDLIHQHGRHALLVTLHHPSETDRWLAELRRDRPARSEPATVGATNAVRA